MVEVVLFLPFDDGTVGVFAFPFALSLAGVGVFELSLPRDACGFALSLAGDVPVVSAGDCACEADAPGLEEVVSVDPVAGGLAEVSVAAGALLLSATAAPADCAYASPVGPKAIANTVRTTVMRKSEINLLGNR